MPIGTFLCKNPVTGDSPAEHIKQALREAGTHRLAHRPHDWPKEREKNQSSWVKPGDIGESTSRSPRLMKRLKALAKAGIIESRSHGSGGTRFRIKT